MKDSDKITCPFGPPQVKSSAPWSTTKLGDISVGKRLSSGKPSKAMKQLINKLLK